MGGHAQSAGRRATGAAIVLALVAHGAGCSARGAEALAHRASDIPAAQREHVHTILINSPLDPLRLTRLPSTAATLRRAGFPNTSFVPAIDGTALLARIDAAHTRDPEAVCVLVGWSGGSLAVWDALSTLTERGQTIEAIAYLDSAWIKRRIAERGHPTNVQRVLLVYRSNHEPPAFSLEPEIVRVPTVNHLAVATHEVTIDAILDLMVDSVPVAESESFGHAER